MNVNANEMKTLKANTVRAIRTGDKGFKCDARLLKLAIAITSLRLDGKTVNFRETGGQEAMREIVSQMTDSQFNDIVTMLNAAAMSFKNAKKSQELQFGVMDDSINVVSNAPTKNENKGTEANKPS
jgi:hypothetical protein